jgi:APA family basic amino acid/polyamine antiporter
MNLKRELGLMDSILLFVGSVIGAGIFIAPSFVALHLGSLGAVLLAWLVGGALSLFGALSLAELGGIFPEAGGLYVYLSHAYGRLAGFLYGWSTFIIIQSATIAGVAIGFAWYLGRLLLLSALERTLVSAGIIVLLTGANSLGLRFGKSIQNCFAIAKVGGLAWMISMLLAHHRSVPQQTWLPEQPLRMPWLAATQALVAILWTYEGWHLLSFTAGEVKDPSRNLSRGYLYGAASVAALYILANVSYYSVLSRSEIQASPTVAAAAMAKVIGPSAQEVISILVLISIFGTLNGLVLTGPRVYYAMARDHLFFERFGSLSPRSATPVFSMVAQGGLAAVFTLLGSYEQLLTDMIFYSWIFYALAVAGVMVLRLRQPESPRPFRIPGYPWLPVLFCLAALAMSVNTFLMRPVRSLIGMAVILSGVPVYAWFQRQKAARQEIAVAAQHEVN